MSFWHFDFFSDSYFSAGLSLCDFLFSKALQVLTEVQKQMSSFDAELKDSKRRAEEMQQAPCVFWYLFLTDMRLWMFKVPRAIRGRARMLISGLGWGGC